MTKFIEGIEQNVLGSEGIASLPRSFSTLLDVVADYAMRSTDTRCASTRLKPQNALCATCLSLKDVSEQLSKFG